MARTKMDTRIKSEYDADCEQRAYPTLKLSATPTAVITRFMRVIQLHAVLRVKDS